MAVRGAADREVLALRPIALVVPALAYGPRPVGVLVPGEPGFAEEPVGQFVLRGLVVVVGGERRARGDAPPEWRAGLDRERVRADVLDLERDRVAHGAAPIFDRFARR